MTNERAEVISQALMSDESQIKALFELEPEEAAKKLAEKGYDFTAEELVEYGEVLDREKKEQENANGELDEAALSEVAGGGVVCVALAGVAVGYWLYKQKW